MVHDKISRFLFLSMIIFVFLSIPGIIGFVIEQVSDEQDLLVGTIYDPHETGQIDINPGSQESALESFPEYPISPNRVMACPQMVTEHNQYQKIQTKHYCRGKEYGYCDIRSGTCFCKDGYQGLSCESCSPSYYKVGVKCFPKKLCPNDCSGAGKCDYATGMCHCMEHREGDSCSKPVCTKFHPLCTACDKTQCLGCLSGYSVDDVNICNSCRRFDPRCFKCDAIRCLDCADLLLWGITQTGARPEDPALPADEIDRQLSYNIPYGTLDPRYFDEAEVYEIVNHPEALPLKDHAQSCDQGINMDDSEECLPVITSHVICGHTGIFTFESPQYTVDENAGFVRVSVRRSGGGLGTVSLTYNLRHITTDDSDTSATAFYTTSQSLTFKQGQIRKSFLVTIHDDRKLESDESFELFLSHPSSDVAFLGNQHRTVVHILDDDREKLCPKASRVILNNSEHFFAVAGQNMNLMITARNCVNAPMKPGDATGHFRAELFAPDFGHQDFDDLHPVSRNPDSLIGPSKVQSDGVYQISINATVAGAYNAYVYHLIEGGLMGTYQRTRSFDSQFQVATRIDAVVNFTWGTGPLLPLGMNSAYIKWEGYIKPDDTGTHTFHFEFDDFSKVWINDELVVDEWENDKSVSYAMVDIHYFEENRFYPIRIHYAEVFGNAKMIIKWESETFPLQVVPKENLFYKVSLKLN